MEVAERLRLGLSCFCCHEHCGNEIKITVSIGVAIISLEKLTKKTRNAEETLQMYIDKADQAMYQAKKNGRNRCHLFKPNKNDQTQYQYQNKHLN
jgi:PleD family two-component response regulator